MLLLCVLATSSCAVTIVPINGDKKIVEPGPTPYWDMGEPGSDPGWRTSSLCGSGNGATAIDSDQAQHAPISSSASGFIRKLTLIIGINYSIYCIRSYNYFWSK